jgi:hypothetical protein
VAEYQQYQEASLDDEEFIEDGEGEYVAEEEELPEVRLLYFFLPSSSFRCLTIRGINQEE